MDTRKHSCHSEHGHVRADGYWVNGGTCVVDNGTRRVQWPVWVEDTMSRECQYRKGVPADPRCEGCNVP